MSWETLPEGSLPLEKPKFQPSAPNSPGTILRSEFDKLSPLDQVRAMRERWRVVDDAPGSKPAPSITRARFDAMPPAGQELFIKRGGTVAE
jgi:hypothetical protein